MRPASRPATRPPDIAVVKIRRARAATERLKGTSLGFERVERVEDAAEVGVESRALVRRMERPFQSMVV